MRKKSRNVPRVNKTHKKDYVYSGIEYTHIPTHKDDTTGVKVSPPSNFSLIHNTEETTKFFVNVQKFIRGQFDKKTDVFFDLSNIKEVTIDAVMYLLATIKNLQVKHLSKFFFRGNMPNDPNAKLMFEESGFLKFVESPKTLIKTNENKIAIRTGRSNDSVVLKEICDFIIDKAGCSRLDTKFLYVMMAEMMYNTYEHAYLNNNPTIKNWYIFVELVDSRIGVTFLDTGAGISNTITKSFLEKIGSKTQDELIKSALLGQFRTKTKLGYRGNGLPTIRGYAETQNITNLHILANKAVCKVNYESTNKWFEGYEQNQNLMGTIYYWEVSIDKLRGGRMHD